MANSFQSLFSKKATSYMFEYTSPYPANLGEQFDNIFFQFTMFLLVIEKKYMSRGPVAISGIIASISS